MKFNYLKSYFLRKVVATLNDVYKEVRRDVQQAYQHGSSITAVCLQHRFRKLKFSSRYISM